MRNLFILIILILLTFGQANAQNKDIRNVKVKNFNEAFAGYQAAINQNNFHLTTIYAQKSYEYGRKEFGDEHTDTLTLALFWLNAYNAHSTDHKFKESVIQNVITDAKNNEAKHADILIEIYISYGTYHLNKSRSKNNSSAQKAFHEALNIANKHNKDDKFLATMKLNIGKNFLSYSNSEAAQQYLFMARDFYATNPAQYVQDLAIANFWVAKYYHNVEQFTQATQTMSQALITIDKIAPSSYFAISGHTLMVQLLEEQGATEEATAHIHRIARAQPINIKSEQIPLYKTPATYPKEALKRKKSGEVLVEFTLDENGFVSDAKAIKGKNMKSFKRSALRAITEYRFTPTIKNGKPVVTKGLLYRFKYSMGEKGKKRAKFGELKKKD